MRLSVAAAPFVLVTSVTSIGRAEPPPTDGPVLGAHIGALRTGASGTSLAGDATAGYATPSFGAVGQGGAVRMRFSGDRTAWTQDELSGHATAWWWSGAPESAFRVGAEGEVGGRRFKTASVVFDPSVTPFVAAERSTLLYGDFAASGKGRPTDAVALYAALGFGLQREVYKRVGVDDTIDLSSDRSVTVRYVARLGGEWRAVPSWLGVRLRGAGELYHRTRDRVTFSSGAATELGVSLDELRCLEVQARLELVALPLTLLGSAPGLYGEAGLQELASPVTTIRVSQTTFGVTWSPSELIP